MGDVELIKYRRRSGDENSPSRGLPPRRSAVDPKPSQAGRRKCSRKQLLLLVLPIVILAVMVIGLAILFGYRSESGEPSASTASGPTESISATVSPTLTENGAGPTESISATVSPTLTENGAVSTTMNKHAAATMQSDPSVQTLNMVTEPVSVKTLAVNDPVMTPSSPASPQRPRPPRASKYPQ